MKKLQASILSDTWKTVKSKGGNQRPSGIYVSHVDYRDQSAVSMSYQMFSRAGEDNTCIDDILSIAENIYSKRNSVGKNKCSCA